MTPQRPALRQQDCYVPGCPARVVVTSSYRDGPTLSACRTHQAALEAMTRSEMQRCASGAVEAQGALW